MAHQDSQSLVAVPAPYRLFFLYLEPLSTVVGAYYAYGRPSDYLAMTAHAPLTTASLGSVAAETTVRVVLAQLANLYLLFAINEACVLRSVLDSNSNSLDARGRRVWSALLSGLLVADLGHLWSVRAYWGRGVYWDVWSWNAMDGGNVGFVYAGALMRVCWLLGVGLGSSSKGGKARQ